MKTRHCTQRRFQLRHTIEMTDRVLRQRLGPATHHSFYGLRQRAEDTAQLRARALDEFVVRLTKKCIAGISTEEGSE
jgi:hypothetical protein